MKITWKGPHQHSIDLLILNELRSIHYGVQNIMASQAEVQARLEAMLAQNEKARAENARLLAELRAAIEAGGASTPEVDNALNNLAASIQAEDDENPDA